jgi:hypothetical protein
MAAAVLDFRSVKLAAKNQAANFAKKPNRKEFVLRVIRGSLFGRAIAATISL